MSAFAEQVAEALDTSDAREAATRVHKVVVAEMLSLDPTAHAELTGYFNHSYVPDVMMSWGTGKQIVRRPVFIRHSLRSSRASGDLENFDRTDQTAFFLSLAREDPDEDLDRVRAAATQRRESRVLVTTVPALDGLATTAADEPDPVLGLVRASVVRSARGAIVEDEMEKLVLPRTRRIQPQELQAFSETVSTAFTADAALRINRVFGIVEQALADEPNSEALQLSGSLTAIEIRELIPYLLRLEGATRDRGFWASVAQLIDLPEIERLWHGFGDLDLTPLASAASGMWQARRVLLSPRAEALGVGDFDRTPRWSVAGNVLTAEVGNWRLAFANQSRKLKTSGRNLPPARWDDLRPSLEPYIVTAVDLQGVVTKSNYGAREPLDMKDRIEAFIASADDSFHLPSVTVVVGSDDRASEVTADFSEMILSASPQTDIATLTRATLAVLGYRYPVEAADVDALLLGSVGNMTEDLTDDDAESNSNVDADDDPDVDPDDDEAHPDEDDPDDDEGRLRRAFE